MRYVYILRSKAARDRHYVGVTADLKRRINEHNKGKSVYTNKYRPWALKTYFAFSEHCKADRFEAYLKSGAGRSFAKKHF